MLSIAHLPACWNCIVYPLSSIAEKSVLVSLPAGIAFCTLCPPSQKSVLVSLPAGIALCTLCPPLQKQVSSCLCLQIPPADLRAAVLRLDPRAVGNEESVAALMQVHCESRCP